MEEKSIIAVLNQLFEIEQKVGEGKIERNLRRIKSSFEESGYEVFNPLNERYDVTRLDCEANIIGDLSDTMIITKVVKPIIVKKVAEDAQVVQRAIVFAESK